MVHRDPIQEEQATLTVLRGDARLEVKFDPRLMIVQKLQGVFEPARRCPPLPHPL